MGKLFNQGSTQDEMEISLSENKRCPQKEIGCHIVLYDVLAMKIVFCGATAHFGPRPPRFEVPGHISLETCARGRAVAIL